MATKSESRFFVRADIVSFFTTKSYDMDGVGEFYFNTNGIRYPAHVNANIEFVKVIYCLKGEILLSANQNFEPPEVRPSLYWGIVKAKKDETFIFDFKVYLQQNSSNFY